MMAFVHSFFVHLPNWFGFLVLIAIWIVFRSILLRWRRGAMERMRMSQFGPMQPPAPIQPPPGPVLTPLAHGQVRCPRCSASAPAAASFCPHCGLALNSLPPPIPHVQYAPRPTRSPLLLLVYILLGLIGLAAFAYWHSGGWDDPQQATPAPPEIRHTHSHDYRWPH